MWEKERERERMRKKEKDNRLIWGESEDRIVNEREKDIKKIYAHRERGGEREMNRDE